MSRIDDIKSDLYYLIDVLTAYERVIESGSCNDCAATNECGHCPNPGELVRYNCPFYTRNDERLS